MVWQVTKPLGTDTVKDGPAVFVGNWAAIEAWTNAEHAGIVTTSAASGGKHWPSHCSIVSTTSAAGLAAPPLNSSPSGSLAICSGNAPYTAGSYFATCSGAAGTWTTVLLNHMLSMTDCQCGDQHTQYLNKSGVRAVTGTLSATDTLGISASTISCSSLLVCAMGATPSITCCGTLLLSGDPIGAHDAVPYDWLFTKLVPLSGGTMTGLLSNTNNIGVSGQVITPTISATTINTCGTVTLSGYPTGVAANYDNEAISKKYVDKGLRSLVFQFPGALVLNALSLYLQVPFACEFIMATGTLSAQSTGAAVSADIDLAADPGGGAPAFGTILTRKVMIETNEYSSLGAGTQPTFSTTSAASGSWFRAQIDAVGTAASCLTVYLWVKPLIIYA